MVQQNENNLTTRRHPDLFTKDEAAAYLCMDSVRTLEWAEEKFHLASYDVGRCKVYHRADLDACALRMTGKDVSQPKARRA
jgi:hypothetical protein